MEGPTRAGQMLWQEFLKSNFQKTRYFISVMDQVFLLFSPGIDTKILFTELQMCLNWYKLGESVQ